MTLNAVQTSTPLGRVGALATAVDQRKLRLVTLEQVLEKVAVGKTLVYQMVGSGQFPASARLSCRPAQAKSISLDASCEPTGALPTVLGLRPHIAGKLHVSQRP